MSSKTALVISVILGVIAVAAIRFGGNAKDRERVEVFQVTASKHAGDTLNGAYEKVMVPLSWYEPMQTRVPKGDQESFVATAPLARSVQQGETVTFDLFSKSIDGGLPAKVSEGMRAVAIEVVGAQAIGYLIRPGDYVDVLATVPYGEVMTSEFVLQAKKVLAVDQSYRIEDPEFVRSTSFSTVTLELRPDEAQKIEILRGLASRGFSLALRPKGDTAIVMTPRLRTDSPQFEQIGNR